MKYLVTGGAGFIGYHLCRRLLENEENSLVIFDNLSTGDISNIKDIIDSERVEFREGNILDFDLVDILCKDCDVVYHLAAAVGVKYIVDNPLLCLDTNIMGTSNILKSVTHHKKRLILFSTSEVYGKNTNKVFSEDDDRILGSTKISRWGYAASKALDEFYALAYHREKGLHVSIVRLFNTVGLKQSSAYGMVIPTLVRQALQNKPLTIHGNGKQSRCFCNVKDVITGLLDIEKARSTNGEIFNLGSNEEITINELATKIIDLTKSKSVINFVNYKEVFGDNFEDMRRRVPDLSKIKRLTGYEPSFTLDKTLIEIINYEKKRRL